MFDLFFDFCFVFGLFSVQTMISSLVYGRTQSGQNQVKGLKPCLVCHVFIKGFFLFKGVFNKYPLDLFW
jgi:hypothetical protein